MKDETALSIVKTMVVSVIIAIVVAAAIYTAPPLEPVIEAIEPEPKQSPYVVYIFVCDELEAVIVTTEPPMSTDVYNRDLPSDEMLTLMFEAENANRVLTFNGGLNLCPKTEPKYYD